MPEVFNHNLNKSLYIFLTLLAVLIILLYQQNQILIRTHNANVFYQSLTCGDLPTDTAACEETLGKLIIPPNIIFPWTDPL